MKKMRKIIGISLITILLVVAIIPMLSKTVLAEEVTKISTLDISYDSEKIGLNVAYKEGEVDSKIRKNTTITTEGTRINLGNTGLRYFNNPEEQPLSLYGIGDGENQVDKDRKYALGMLIYVNDGFDWSDEIKSSFNNSNQLITKCPSFTINLNGIKKEDALVEYNSSNNFIRTYIPLGKPSTDPIITGVSIEQNNMSMQIGTNNTFSVNVTGTADDKTVTWSVENAISANTVIDTEGKLTIGNDETAKEIIVKATSNFDNSKYATKIVTVTQEAPTIDSVTVTPATISLYPKESKSFKTTVTGTQTDKSVIWSIEGQLSANTIIYDDGYFVVGKDETAKTITVKATSTKDPSKFGTSTVTIIQRSRVKEINLTFDTEKIFIDTSKTEGELNTIIRQNIDKKSEEYSIDLGNSGLGYYIETVEHGIGDGKNQVQEGRKYYIEYNLELSYGYDWIESAKTVFAEKSKIITECKDITLKANGILRKDVKLYYNDYWNNLKVYIPICLEHTAKEIVTTNIKKANLSTNGVINKSIKVACTVCGADIGGRGDTEIIYYPKTIKLSATSYKYNGKVRRPSVQVIGADGKAIIASNYDVVYSNKNSTKPGIYTVTVKFKGLYYEGTKTLNYNINPKGVSLKKLTKGKKQFYATWGKNTTQTTGYELQYATDSKFTKNVKKVKIKSNKTTSKTVKSLKKNKKYYVRIRTYKTVKVNKKDVKVYSEWSKVLNVKTK